MKVEYLNPFVTSTINTFSTMLGMKPVRGKPEVSTTPTATHEVSAIIGMSGVKAQGTVVFSLSKEMALKTVSKFLGEQVGEFNPGVADGIGELVNIIAGGAKADLNKSGLGLELALPTVVVGQNHMVWQKSGVARIIVPFSCELGEFTVEFSIKTE